MTLAHADQCSESTARALTDQLRQSLSMSWELLVEAYQRRAWAALGYESWDAYTDGELGETRLRLPREQRREVVQSMTESGMSTRAIGSALGVHHDTIADDRRAVGNPTPADEVVDAEIVDEPDELGDRIARELAASDDAYAERSTVPNGIHGAVYGKDESVPDVKNNRVQGTDGKSYPVNGSRLAIPPKPKYGNRRKHLQVMQAMTTTLAGLTAATDEITELDQSVTQEEAALILRDLSRQIGSLNQIKNLLKERTS